jgi:hypothetical protein
MEIGRIEARKSRSLWREFWTEVEDGVGADGWDPLSVRERKKTVVPVRGGELGHGRNWRWAERLPPGPFLFFCVLSFSLFCFFYFFHNFFNFGPN